MSLRNHQARNATEGALLQSTGWWVAVRFTTLIPVSLLRSVAMANGTVDFFNDTGGYGFIDTDDADDDVFFHMEDVGGPDLEEGQDVEFDIEQSPKGPRASNLTRL
jgi:CspA family cold shock protein